MPTTWLHLSRSQKVILDIHPGFYATFLSHTIFVFLFKIKRQKILWLCCFSHTDVKLESERFLPSLSALSISSLQLILAYFYLLGEYKRKGPLSGYSKNSSYQMFSKLQQPPRIQYPAIPLSLMSGLQAERNYQRTKATTITSGQCMDSVLKAQPVLRRVWINIWHFDKWGKHVRNCCQKDEHFRMEG